MCQSSKETVEVLQGEHKGDEKKLREICARSRRTIGLTPVEPFMLEIQKRSYGAKTEEEAMVMEVKNYLKCEMKVRPSVILIPLMRCFLVAVCHIVAQYLED